MADISKSKDAPKSKAAQDRDARLAEALRQNLRRRKVQAKSRDVEPEPPEKKPD